MATTIIPTPDINNDNGVNGQDATAAPITAGTSPAHATLNLDNGVNNKATDATASSVPSVADGDINLDNGIDGGATTTLTYGTSGEAKFAMQHGLYSKGFFPGVK